MFEKILIGLIVAGARCWRDRWEMRYQVLSQAFLKSCMMLPGPLGQVPAGEEFPGQRNFPAVFQSRIRGIDQLKMGESL